MGRQTTAPPLPHRQALNKTLVFAQSAPAAAAHAPAVYVRALRATLRMSQENLARRSGVAKSQIVEIEKGRMNPGVDVLRRLFDAMFCDLLVVPKARKRPSDALAEQFLERPREPGYWSVKRKRGPWD